MREPLVSIIVNNFNYGRFVGAAIESALAQDHRPVEVIVVDDGSTDESREVISRYGSRVRAVFKDNGGQGSAFNAGFSVSSGRIVNFLDADDILYADAASRAVSALADPSVSQWMAPLDLVDGDGKGMGRIFPDHPLPSGDLRDRALTYGPWAYQVVPTSGNFWARGFLEQVLPVPAEFRVGGDEYLYSIAALYGRIASDGRTVGGYRGHGANVYWRSHIAVEDVANDFLYFERICRTIQDHADRLGVPVDPSRWVQSDWRQQVRRVLLYRSGREGEAPQPAQVLGAVWRDQTRLHKKMVLVPAVAAVLALPRGPATSLGLRLLARR